MDKKQAIVHKALESYSVAFPNSVIGDLMMMFPDDVVIKMIATFSGENVKFPHVESIWIYYRNAVVVETLNLKNDKPTRQRLAAYFGVSASYVARIYREERDRHPLHKRSAVRRTVRTAYRNLFDGMMKDAKETLR